MRAIRTLTFAFSGLSLCAGAHALTATHYNVVLPSTIVSGTTATITISPVDLNENVDATYKGTANIVIAGVPVNTPPGSVTFSPGKPTVIQITFTGTGSATFTVNDTAAGAGTIYVQCHDNDIKRAISVLRMFRVNRDRLYVEHRARNGLQ